MVGIFFSLVGFLLAAALVIQKAINPATPVGWTSLIVAILIVGGIQLLALGVIGEYVGRVLLNVANRPQFVTREFLNLDIAGTGHSRHPGPEPSSHPTHAGVDQ